MMSNNLSNTSFCGERPELNTLERCDVCNSTNIAETREGFVCKDCGIVLQVQKFEYYRPYNDDIIQYAVLGKTQMGFKRERMALQHSDRLEHQSKLNSIITAKKAVDRNVRIEIKRILTNLRIPLSFVDAIYKKVIEIRSKLGVGTKYRNPEKLVPIIIYLFFKLKGKTINKHEILEVSKTTKKEFHSFLLQIDLFVPQYVERNRKEYILQRVMEITEHFNLGMLFYYQSKKILYKLWDTIKGTTDNVIGGLVCSISALCLDNVDIKVSAICNQLNIRMSTIQCQVEKKIFEHYNVSGFESLIKSSHLLRKVMIKLGLFESFPKESDILEVKLGYVNNIFNSLNDLEVYMFMLNNGRNIPIFTKLTLNKTLGLIGLKQIGEKIEDSKLFEFDSYRYHYPRGPPLLYT
ncbi:MAG: hypothetical protein ACFFA8_05410 [Promethearchaeota archaeon]